MQRHAIDGFPVTRPLKNIFSQKIQHIFVTNLQAKFQADIMIRFSNKTYSNFIKFMQSEAQKHKKPIILRSALARQSVRGRSTLTTQSCRGNRMAQRKTPRIEIWQLYGAGHYFTKPLIF